MLILKFIIWGTIWGVVCNKVIKNKGYDENWFWWGFFFNIIAVIIAFSKPQVQNNSMNSQYDTVLSSVAEEIRVKEYLKDGGWRCIKCNTVNPHYKDRCSCGQTKEKNSNNIITKQIPQTDSEPTLNLKSENEKIELIKKYKELLDMGGITEDEFNQKKEEILSDSLSTKEKNENKMLTKKEKVNGWVCSNCETINSEDAKLCQYCGAVRMISPYKKKVDTNLLDWMCPKCNKINKCYIGRCECGISKSQGKLIKEEI